MSQEILYTSAPQGLKPGSRGFCTVVSTYGMAKNLAQRLESLSGYRHVFLPPDARAARNPVNFSHLLMTVGGRKYHVLSRIADAGLDYTNRTNKLAHHVALTDQEIGPCRQGPAELLQAESFSETKWDGKANGRHPGRTPPPGKPVPRKCLYWEELTGDAGWAGVLAASALDEHSRPVSVIFRLGTDTLRLVSEAMSLLPPEQRWKVTFSTYFTKLPAGVSCLWRFLVDGTVEAKATRRNPHLPVIDLCRPPGNAPASEAVAAAQEGRLINTAGPAAGPPAVEEGVPAAPPENLPDTADIYGVVREPPPYAPMAGGSGREVSGARRLGEIEYLPETPLRSRGRRKKRMVLLGGTAVSLILTLIAGVLGIALYLQWYGGPSSQEIVEAVDPPDEPKPPKEPEGPPPREIPEEPTEPPGEAPPPTPPPENGPISPDPEAPSEPEAPENPAPGSADPAGEGNGDPPPPESPPEPRDPFADIRKRNLHLPLPNQYYGIGNRSEKEVELAKIFVNSPKSCDLLICGSEEVLDKGMTFVMQRQDERGGRSTWEVRTKAGETLAKPQQIATFTLEDQRLKFKWDPKAADTARPRSLQYCLLEIRAGEDKVRCLLANPDEVEPVEIGLESQKSTSSLPLDSKSIPRRENLRLDLQLSDFPRSALTKQHGLKVDEAAVIQVFEPDESGNKRFLDVQVQLSLEPEPEPEPGLVFAMTSHQKRLTPGTRNVYPSEEPISLDHLEDLRRICSKDRLQRLGTDLKRFDTQIGNLQEKLNRVKEELGQIHEALARLKVPKNATEREKGQINHERGLLRIKESPRLEAEADFARNLATAHAEKADKEFLRNFFQGNAVWCDRMTKVLEQLHAKSKVQFRIYTEVEGRQVDVLRSKGYRSNKP